MLALQTDRYFKWKITHVKKHVNPAGSEGRVVRGGLWNSLRTEGRSLLKFAGDDYDPMYWIEGAFAASLSVAFSGS